jgi:hypothetical protein
MSNQEFFIEAEQLFIDQKKMPGEIKLWREVIYKALEDLKLPLTNKRYRTWQKQAKEWFEKEDEEFIMVCECANLAPEHVLKLARKIKRDS